MRHSSDPVGSNPNASDSWKARVLKMAERGEFDPQRVAQRSAERSSLVRLAWSATRLHKAGLAKGMTWPAGEGSPLAVASAALATAIRHNKE
jgi:hypothetical protein